MNRYKDPVCEDAIKRPLSPFLRTLETADAIRQSTGLAPEAWVALHEQGGCYAGYTQDNITGRPGLTRSEINSRFPDFQIPDEIDGDGWWKRKPHENVGQARARAAKLHRRTMETFAHNNECVAYVMHGDFKLLFLDSLQIAPLDVADNAAVSKITIEDDDAKREYFNKTDHLPDSVITC